MLKSYMATLKAATDEATRHRAAEAEAKLQRAPARRPQAKSLSDQVHELLLTLPPAMLAKPWAIEDFINRLEGRYREYPAASQVAKILLSMGWIKYRDWSASGRGRRYWSNGGSG